MSPHESEALIPEGQAGTDRLEEWKARRAEIAEASRAERLTKAEEQRQARLRNSDADRQARAKDAADRRARELAQERADRMAAARAKLAGRAEIDAARERLAHYRSHAAQAFVTRLILFVLIPTCLVGGYLFAVATPLYEARTVIAVRAPEASDTPQPLFSMPAGTEAAHQVKAIMLATPTLRAVDVNEDMAGHYGATEMDPLRRLRPLDALQISTADQLRRFIWADVRAFEGVVTLSVLARSPDDAIRFSQAIVDHTQADLSVLSAERAAAMTTIIAPAAEHMASSPHRVGGTALALICFVVLYAMGSIFAATLRRHAWA